jgi:hypothetical protein
MPISSKRSGSQQTISRHQQDKQYNDYVYYPGQYEEQSGQYYQTRVMNNSAPVHRT